jgi:hypothetical protein
MGVMERKDARGIRVAMGIRVAREIEGALGLRGLKAPMVTLV